MAGTLKEKGAKEIVLADLARCNMSRALAEAFRYDKIIFASPTYNAGVFPCVEDFLHHLRGKNFQKRKVGLIENGSWAPTAAKAMTAILGGMKDLDICENTVTIKSAFKSTDYAQLERLADEILK